MRFAAVGGVSTAAHLVLFLVLRPVLDTQPANLVALALTTVANTAANRRFTFGIRGRDGAATAQLQGLLVFALGLASTSGVLAALHDWYPGAAQGTELVSLVGANLVATLLRFGLLRTWVFRDRTAVSQVTTSDLNDFRPAGKYSS